jgi:hypothetical protein
MTDERAVVVVEPRGPRWLRLAFVVAAVAYLTLLWLSAAHETPPLPSTVRFFVDAAGLFPDKSEKTIDYRAEIWRCDSQGFVELDVSSVFPIHGNDKENLVTRALYFHRYNAKVMRALDDYIVAHVDAASTTKVGGVRLSSLRIPIPARDASSPRPYAHTPLDEVEANASSTGIEKKVWYTTTDDAIADRCSR